MALSDAIKQQIKQNVENMRSGGSSAPQQYSNSYDYGTDWMRERLKQNMDYYYQNGRIDPVKSFVTEANKFFQGVEKEVNESKGFNAAEFFEDRKRQGNILKSWAANLSSFMDNNSDLYTPEYYEETKNILAAFDTDVDDVLSYYQPAVNAKAGMQAYDDEYRAYQEKQRQVAQAMSNPWNMPEITNPAYGFLNMQNQYRADTSYLAVSDSWTDDERYQLGLLQQEDPAKARDFARQVNDYHNAEATAAQRQAVRDAATQSFGAGALHTAGALGTSILMGIPEFLDRMAEYTVRGTTTEKAGMMPTDYSNEVVGGISENLNQRYGTIGEGVPILGGRGVGDLYNLGYSIGQNLLSRHTLGAVGGQPLVLASYFANAANSGIDEARRRGASGDQAMKKGLITGALEVATEFVPTSRLFKMGPAVTVGQLLKEVGMESLDEFVGEGLNAALGYGADMLIMDDMSEYETSKRNYMEQGMTEEEAHVQTLKDAVSDIIYEGLSGAVSGALSAGAETAYKTGTANRYYRNVNPQSLIDEGMNTNADSKAYQLAEQMQQKVDSNQDISGNQKRILAQNTQIQQQAEAMTAAETAAADDLTAMGETGDVKKLANIVARKSMGEKLTRADQKAIRGSENVQALLDAMAETDEESAVESAEPLEVHTEEVPGKVSKDGRAIQISTDSAIDTLDFASMDNGKATIQLKDGGTVDYDDVVFATQGDANRFYAVKSLPGMDTESANNLFHTIEDAKAGEDLDSVAGIREAYGMGYYGFQQSDLAKGEDSSRLTPELSKAIFDIGRQQRNAAVTVPVKAQATTKPTEGYKKVVIEGKVNTRNPKTKAEIAFVDYIAENFSGAAVHVYESFKGRDGKRYYRDNNGKVQRAPNGMYVKDEIWVDTKAGNRGEGLMLNTFGHEMYHHVEKWNKPKAQELTEFIVRELGMESVDKALAEQIKKARKAGVGESYFVKEFGMTEEQAANEVYSRAMSDFVADSLETMFTRGNAAESVARLHSEHHDLFDVIKEFVDTWVGKLKEFYSDKTISQEGAAVAQLESFEKIQQMFMEAMKGAGENYQAALTHGESGEVVNADGDPVAMSTEDGSVMLSIRTYEEDGRKVFRSYLDKCVTSNRLTEQQAKEMRDGIEEIYEICKEFKDKYAPFSRWSDAEVIRDTYGRPVFSVVTPNGEYKMNLDFSLVCKKRRTLDAVFNEMSRRGIIDDFELGQKTVVKINELIRKHSFETACSLCFVDAKRFRQADVADSFVRLYNELVESLVPEDRKGEISHFNFAGVENLGKKRGIEKLSNSELDFTHIDEVLKNYKKGTVEHKAARYIKANPKGRKLLMRGDFMSSAGFDAVKSQNKDIMKLYNSKKGTGGPKAAFGDVQYLNEVIRKAKGWTPEKAYKVGGVRIQSFSDYVARMVFDYTQMIYDLAATKLPAHAYTKEVLFVKQFGLTGVKINMSLIPAIADDGIAPGLDANGNYVWAGESFDYDAAVEIQNADGYTENCGTICVGVSDAHIRKLLTDPNIRMVIPYHKSGLNPIVAHMNRIAAFKNYTDFQNTKDRKTGSKVSKEFNFNEELRKAGDPKAVATQYLAWCAQNDYIPKFQEFAKDENYYKLLIDFTVYDKNGQYVPQREVRAVFPTDGNAFGTMKDLIRQGLEEDAIIEGRRDKELPGIVDEIQRTIPRTEAEIDEAEVTQADRDLEAEAMFSHRDYEAQVDEVKNNTHDPNNHVNMGTTAPALVKLLGLPKIPMLITPNHVYSISVSAAQAKLENRFRRGVNYHGLGWEKTKQLPEMIGKPAMIIKSNTDKTDASFVVITYEVDSAGDPIIAAIKPDGKGNYFNLEFPSIAVLSGYGKHNLQNYIARAKTENRILYVDKRNSQRANTTGVQFSDNIRSSDYTTNLTEFREIVKKKYKGTVFENGQLPDFSLRNDVYDSPRSILARALASEAKNDADRNVLNRYQQRVGELNRLDIRLRALNDEIQKLSADEKGNKKQLSELRIEARNIQRKIDYYDRKLLDLESTAMMKRLVEAERKKLADAKVDFKAEQRAAVKAMQAEQRILREELTGKESDITIMEKEFIRLAKEHEAERVKSETLTKKLKQAAAQKADSKIWEKEFGRLLKEYDAAGRKIDRLEQTILRQRATAKARVEGRRNTEMRHKIQRKADNLNRLLLQGGKDRNIPIGLQKPVAEILDAINMEVRDAEQRERNYESVIARYDRQIAMATDPLVVEALTEKRDRYAAKGDQFANKMGNLKKAYDDIRNDPDPLIQNAYDEVLSDYLDTLVEKIGDTPLGQMNRDQLEAVNEILTAVQERVRSANEAFAEGKKKRISEMGAAAIRQVRTVGGERNKGKVTANVIAGINNFGWNNMRPIDALEAIGSDELTEDYKNLRKGEDTWARDMGEAKEFFQNQWKKHHADKWDLSREFTFTSASDQKFKLTLEQIMSIYAHFRREQSREHLRKGGFVFDSSQESTVKVGPVKIPVKGKTADATAYNLSDEILGEIIGKLTPEQAAFVEEMQSYLSDTMGAKGNEVSLKMYGIKLFKEKVYFPLRSASQFMERAKAQQTGDVKMKNAGFTKAVKPNANNPVVLTPFLTVWAEHVDQMSNYHAFVLPLEDFYRVYNFKADMTSEQLATQSVQAAIQNAYGEGAVKYIDQLLKDINGGVRADSTVGSMNSWISRYKKGATLASASVFIQQPSAILRATAMVDPKYFLGRKVDAKYHDRTWDEIKKWAPIASIKEIGSFDTNMGKTAVDYLTGQEYQGFEEKFKAFFKDGEFRDEMLGQLPALADELSWGVMWNAIKREQADLHPNMNVKSDEFMKLVADRFTDVVVHTQVYDSVFSRSAMMRSKDTGMKMATAFMAEPTVTVNMLANAIIRGKRTGSRVPAARTIASIVAAQTLNAMLVSFVYAMRDDDEEERYDEKWIASFRGNLLSSLDPRGYIPFLRDIRSIFQGYDVERADMSVTSDFADAFKSLFDEEMGAWDKVEKFTGALFQIFGVPAKNVMRDVRGLWNTFRIAFNVDNDATSTGYYMALTGKNLNDGEELLLAIQRDDQEHIERVASRFESQQKAESALQSAIREEYLSGKITAEEAEELLTTNFDRDSEHDVYWIMDSWDYAKANGNAEGYAKFNNLRAAIDSGEGYEAEIDRHLQHGAEPSDVRSQISKAYRKQYLEATADEQGEIREKLLPVYEYTGLDEQEVMDKFNDWDFESRYGMTYSQYKAEYREGNVTESQLREAMDSYGLMNFEIEETVRDLNEEIAFHDRYGMSMTEMKDAYDKGEVSRSSLISALVYSGKTETEARKEVTQRDIENRLGIDYAKLDDAYKHGDISRQELYNAMKENGATTEEASEAIICYDWLKKNIKKHPDLAISDARRFVVRVSDKMEERTLADFGVSIDIYKQYVVKAKDCPGVDADGDGKIDSYSRAKQLFAMIDKLPISSEAKDGLAYITNAKSTIKKYAPWR